MHRQDAYPTFIFKIKRWAKIEKINPKLLEKA
jgi:hypothetical protein